MAWLLAAMIHLMSPAAEWTSAQDAAQEVASRAEVANSTQSRDFKFPPRLASAMRGPDFIQRIRDASLDEREAAILHEILSGNFPQFLRRFKSVPIRGTIKVDNQEREVATTIDVMPDYLSIGSDDDFARMPMTPQTAQQIADHFGCILPTRKIVDAIDAHAELHLEPRPLTHKREAVATFLEHHEIIEQQRADGPLGVLIVGTKKDIVLSPRIFERAHRLAIYGWRQLDGRPIQPLTTVHFSHYVDYSHGVRLVRDEITLDGREMTISELLADPDLCALVSDEGTMTPPCYPLD
jgi:hypothetical protein